MGFLRRAAVGAMAGLLAGVAVAVFFLVEGTVHVHPFYVPVTLASGLLGEWVSSAVSVSLFSVAVDTAEVLVYTVIHLLAFAAVGAIGAFLLVGRSFWGNLWGGVAYGGVVCTGLLYASRWVAATPVSLSALGLPSVVLANAMAGAIIGLGLHLSRSDQPAGPPS